jgi:prophage regulatory protein
MQKKELHRLPQVKQTVGMSRSEIYRQIKLGRFPRSIPLGARTVAWDADEVQAWIRSRIEARKENLV